ncbi:hypothetical protein FQA39_LY16627 [Lamprigera yunnana]|nr:hypothetical protein FQA39_LY16627 [Lamprigera yunnana]
MEGASSRHNQYCINTKAIELAHRISHNLIFLVIHCPAIMCSPPYCRYGYDVDENGCPSCKCIDPCKNHECSLDEDCEVLPISCRGEPYCGTKVKCVKKCKDQNCGNISCTYGFERDCNNCPTCVCNEPCNNVVCPKYHYCMVERVNCYVPPCPSPYAFCESYCGENQILRNNYGELVTCTNNSCPVGHKQCADLGCDLFCLYDFERDSDNCPLCSCSDPCKNVICPKFHNCVAEAIPCFTSSCPVPNVTCKPYCKENNILIDEYEQQYTCENHICPAGYVCNKINEFSKLYCCSETVE